MNIHELSDLDADALTITTRGTHTWVTCTSEGEEVTVGPFPTQKLTSALPRHSDDMDGGVTAALIEKETEKPTAADFATAKFARDPGGDATAHRTPMGFWTSRTFHGIDDEAMARGGWSPVRECPDPEAHTLTGIARAVAAVTPCSCSAQRARAEKAEKERDHALRLAKTAADQADDALGMVARGECHGCAAEPRPLTPEVTDEMVERAGIAERTLPTTVSHRELLRGIVRAALSDPRPVHAPVLEDDLAAFADTELPHTDKARADWLTARGWQKSAGAATEGGGER